MRQALRIMRQALFVMRQASPKDLNRKEKRHETGVPRHYLIALQWRSTLSGDGLDGAFTCIGVQYTFHINSRGLGRPEIISDPGHLEPPRTSPSRIIFGVLSLKHGHAGNCRYAGCYKLGLFGGCQEASKAHEVPVMVYMSLGLRLGSLFVR